MLFFSVWIRSERMLELEGQQPTPQQQNRRESSSRIFHCNHHLAIPNLHLQLHETCVSLGQLFRHRFCRNKKSALCSRNCLCTSHNRAKTASPAKENNIQKLSCACERCQTLQGTFPGKTVISLNCG